MTSEAVESADAPRSRVPGWLWPLALALVLRCIGLGDDDFWSDEVHTYQALELPLAELVRERLTAGHLPLYFVLLDLWSEVFGAGHLSLRLPSALAGAATVVPGWFLLRALLPDRASALFGTTLLAVHPVWVELSREARMYPFVALAFMIVALAVARGRDRGPTVLMWGAALVGPLLHATWMFGLAALVAIAVVRRTRRRSVWLLLALSGLALAVAVPSADLPAQELVRRPWLREGAVYGLRQFAGADVRTSLLWLYVPLVAGWATVLVLGARAADRRVRQWALLLVAVVHGGVVVAGWLTTVPWGPTRYVALAVPGLVLLAAPAFRRMRVACVGVVLLSVAIIGADVTDVDRRASREAATGGPIVVEADPPSVPEQARRLVREHYLAHPREPR